jgi:hypothetical protein
MVRATDAAPKRLRISIDVDPELRHRLRLAAARRDLSVRHYVLAAIQERLRQDVGGEDGSAFSAADDPVLAELWDNPLDAEYDHL